MKEVFGKTLICRDIDMASYFAKNANMDSITMEGQLMCLRFTVETENVLLVSRFVPHSNVQWLSKILSLPSRTYNI